MRHFFSLLAIAFLFSIQQSQAQSVAVNTDGSTANSSAILDVKSTGKGVLIPRMTRAERNAIPSPATGLMVFQNGPDSVGFYYYDGSSWSWVVSNSNADSLAWTTKGNTGTNTASHFLGTTDNKALVIKTNGTERMQVTADGNLQFTGALMPAASAGTSGQVLTSAGPSAPPTWTSPGSSLFDNIFQAYSTGAVATSTTWQIIPGVSTQVTVPAGRTAKMIINAGVGLFTNCATNGGISGTDIAIYRNGVILPNGGLRRVYLGDALIDLDENNVYGNPSMQVIETLAAGTYTYDLRCWQQLTGSCNASVGGASGDIRQGVLSVIMVLQ